MKQFIVPIAIGLLAGLGGGTGFAYMKTSAKYAADSKHVADSLKAHEADSTHADSTHSDTTGHDAAAADSGAHGMDASGSHEAAPPVTPADSIRLLEAARRDLKAITEKSSAVKPSPAHAADTHAPSSKPDAKARGTASTLKSQTAGGSDTPTPATPSPAGASAAVTKGAKEIAPPTVPPTVPPAALPEQRLAKIFAAMPAKDAVKVLDQMADVDVRTILSSMNDRQAAAILASMPAARAAAVTKGSAKVPGGSQ